ncbi:MAG: carboxypeptidase-like regulatory domain-containing protein [Candidatus Parvarchaeota archaeon]
MKDNTGWIVGGGVAVAGAAGAGYVISKKCAGIVVTLSGPSSAQPEVSVNYTVNVQQNNQPIATQVTLIENATETLQTATTDSNGNADFSVMFSSAGNYSLTAEVTCAYLLKFTSNTITVTVSSTSCSCPTGEVCEVNGVCPMGYISDPNNAGCCMPSPTSCNCPSGEVCEVNGECPANTFPDQYNSGCCIPCSQLIPYSIENITQTPAQEYYYVNGQDYSVHPSCPSCYGNCTTNTTYPQGVVEISGTVVDPAGHPICNQQVTATPTVPYQLVSAQYNVIVLNPIAPTETVTVEWKISLQGGSTTTDDNGNFTFQLPVGVTDIVGGKMAPLVPGCYPNTSPAEANFVVNIDVAGTSITLPASATIYLHSSLSWPA